MCRLHLFVLDSHLATLWESNCPFGFLLVMFPWGSSYFVFVFLSLWCLWWEVWDICIDSWSLPFLLSPTNRSKAVFCSSLCTGDFICGVFFSFLFLLLLFCSYAREGFSLWLWFGSLTYVFLAFYLVFRILFCLCAIVQRKCVIANAHLYYFIYKD